MDCTKKMLPGNILLVDDDPLIRKLGRELLECLGYAVATAADAPRALTAFQRLPGVDLVILDYHLPGPNGYELLKELKGLDTGVRVLMITGFISKREAARLEASGIEGIIYKPFRLAELKRKIHAVLGKTPGC